MKAIRDIPLSELFARMREGSNSAAGEEAWAEVYRRYQQRVWTRVYYVVRTISWLREPSEVASDVTGQVFLGLPGAVGRYQDIGRAEQWLMNIALRTALRHKESLTGNWSTGGSGSRPKTPRGRGRSYLDVDDAAGEIATVIDEVEADERFELRRLLESWKSDPAKQRWLELVELFIEGYSHDEIAEKLQITSGTSRTLLWKIRQHLAELGEEDRMRDEVGGRMDAQVIPFKPRLATHIDHDTLGEYADGLLSADDDARVSEHVAGCALCLSVVQRMRRGLALLAAATEPPAGLAGQVRARRASGERTLLPDAGAGMADDLLDVVGRDAGADAGADTDSTAEPS